MSDLTLYKDRGKQHPFVIEDIGDVEAGDSKIIEAYLSNETSFEIIRIGADIGDKDIILTGIPERIEPKSTHPVLINYSPGKLRTRPLDTFVTFHGKKRIPPE